MGVVELLWETESLWPFGQVMVSCVQYCPLDKDASQSWYKDIQPLVLHNVELLLIFHHIIFQWLWKLHMNLSQNIGYDLIIWKCPVTSVTKGFPTYLFPFVSFILKMRLIFKPIPLLQFAKQKWCRHVSKFIVYHHRY